MRTAVLALLVLAIAAALVPAPAAALFEGPLQATLDGPSALAPSQTAAYNISIVGGPTVNVTYTVEYYITGANTTGANPLKNSPGSTSGNHTATRINITAPTQEETITLTVIVTATPKSGSRENVTVTKDITVVRAIVLSATFRNSGTTAALNVTVRWYVDDTLVGTSVLKQIGANADATVTFTYLPAGLAAGEHTVKVTADLDHDGVINAARGEVVTSTIFYNQVSQPATGWVLLLGIGVFIPVFLGVVAVRRRGQQ